jgi:hypothetical protein
MRAISTTTTPKAASIAGRLPGGVSPESAAGHAPTVAAANVNPVRPYSTAKIVTKIFRNVEILRERDIANARMTPVAATPSN